MTNAGFRPFLAMFIDDITYQSQVYPDPQHGVNRLADLSTWWQAAR